MRSQIFVLLFLLGAVCGRKGGKKVDVSKYVLNPDKEALQKSSRGEFNPDLLEGDIASKDGKPNAEDRNAVKDENQLWGKGIVPYVFHSSLSSPMKEKIKAAMADYRKYTCIKFVPRQHEQAFVNFSSTRQGCFAWLGRHGYYPNPINLQDPPCRTKGTVIHEILHTIGFAHEQSRNDRDDHVSIQWDNIPKAWHSQYEKMGEDEENNQGFPYDYASVMHYPDWGWVAGTKSILTNDPKFQDVIGQRLGFSPQDVEEVKKLYKCRGKVSGVPENKPDSVNPETGTTKRPPTCFDKAPNCPDIVKSRGKKICEEAADSMLVMCRLSCGVCSEEENNV